MRSAAAVLILLLTAAAAPAPPACTGRTAAQADAALDHLTGWAEIRAYARAYPGCDDGEYSERLADRITTLLAAGPAANRPLFDLARREAAFLTFVLDHIDSTAASDALEGIARTFGAGCAAADRELCKRIAQTARDALE